MANPLKVVIVGGGIGGISAAIAILIAGHSVTVLEAAERIEEARIVPPRLSSYADLAGPRLEQGCSSQPMQPGF
jgi:2-polyprenyl-6-methoxyphenol hydroxylase-like FAD-dependent oxidoreductase